MTPTKTESPDLETAPIVLPSFEDFELSPETIKSLTKMGFTAPTPIQVQTIPILLKGESDFIGLASTGTGKTAAFGIPLIEKIDLDNSSIQSLILCPTRELCLQVADQIQKIGEYKGLRTLAIIGGDSYRKQRDGLRRNPHVVISTPGRLIDLLEQGALDLSTINYLILDEADEMISIGFREALDQILSSIRGDVKDVEPSNKIWLFSATMSSDIRKVAGKYLKDHKSIQVNRDTPLSGTVEQAYYTVQDKNKLETLARILAVTHPFYGIIFCQTKAEVAEVASLLQKRNFSVDCLHGDKIQKEREWILKRFKSKELTVIVATDVAARGLDIKDLTHVINYNLPWDVDSYVHRIGRTGRNGQKGQALTLVSPKELRLMRRIQQFTKVTLRKADIPTADQVAIFKINQIMKDTIVDETNSKKVSFTEDLVKEVQENLALDFNSESTKIIAKFIMKYHPELIIEKENFLDYSPGRIPDEMMVGGGSFSSGGGDRSRGGRSGGGGGRSYGGGRGGDRGGDRPRSDRGASASFSSRSSSAAYSGGDSRPRFDQDSSGGDRAERPARRFGTAVDRTESGFKRAPRSLEEDSRPRFPKSTDRGSDRPARAESGDRPFRGASSSASASASSRPASRPSRSSSGESAGFKKDHPGVKRVRRPSKDKY